MRSVQRLTSCIRSVSEDNSWRAGVVHQNLLQDGNVSADCLQVRHTNVGM